MLEVVTSGWFEWRKCSKVYKVSILRGKTNCKVTLTSTFLRLHHRQVVVLRYCRKFDIR